MNIANKIKQLRSKAGLTQEQLASTLGISAQSVSKWENSVTMPDITLLPQLAIQLGVSIDELFDLTTDQRLRRIEKRLDLEEDLPSDVFKEYEVFLTEQLREGENKGKVLSLLAELYHHRMTADSIRVSKYAREAIMLSPEVKECQWLLQKAEGAVCWDWNLANHTSVINFYKQVIKRSSGRSRMPYYEVIDNLLADHRVSEAREYFEIYKTLPGIKPFLTPVYEAYFALGEYDVKRADEIMESALGEFCNDSGFLFEKAQYHARRCEYKKAIEFYEKSFDEKINKKPRYTDALQGIATVYEILCDRENALKTLDRMIECIKDEWGYSDEDAAVTEVKREKERLLSSDI